MSRSRDLANLANNASGLETLTVSDITDLTATATELNKLDGFTGVVGDLNYAKDLNATGVTSTEYDYLDGVSSALQTQIDEAGIKEFDQWRYTADITSNAVISTDSNWERFDTDSFSQIGTGMTVSSGVFTFATTGIYLILANVTYESNSAAVTHPRIDVELTTDNASYNSRGRASSGQQSGDLGYFISASCAVPFKVSNTSTHKIRFQTVNTSSTAKFKGRTDLNENSFTFIRVGDV